MTDLHVHGGPGFKRCPNPICRALRAAKRREDRETKRAQRYWSATQNAWIHPDAPHGTATGYSDWCCRCVTVPGTETHKHPQPGCKPVGVAATTTGRRRTT